LTNDSSVLAAEIRVLVLIRFTDPPAIPLTVVSKVLPVEVFPIEFTMLPVEVTPFTSLVIVFPVEVIVLLLIIG
jgi:hypothetical protein